MFEGIFWSKFAGFFKVLKLAEGSLEDIKKLEACFQNPKLSLARSTSNLTEKMDN